MNEWLIINAVLVTWEHPNRIIPSGALLIRDGLIMAIGEDQALRQQYPHLHTVDAQGQLVMPGNICAHTHFYGAFARGMAVPGAPMQDFPDILQRLWWWLDRGLTLEDVRYSALVCLVDAIKHGTTTLVDHHASPNAIEGSLDVIAEAVTLAGVRGALCYEVTDRNGQAGTIAGISENIRFLQHLQTQPHPLLAGLFGLHASLSLSDETVADCVHAVQKSGYGFHIHAAEHEADEYDSLYRYGKRVGQRLADAGILGPRSIVAHAVHITPAEMNLLHNSQTWVTHQPRSNMNNAVGAANIEGMLQLGIPVCLGNDGFSNNMWAEWKAAYLLHKIIHRDPRRMNGVDVVQMAIYHNAALAQQLWQGLPIGKLVVGAAADLIFVDYHPTTPLSAGNLPWHILFGFESSMVTTTICAGKLLMHNRQLLTLDEARITAKSQERAAQLWQRLTQL